MEELIRDIYDPNLETELAELNNKLGEDNGQDN